jgi:hypothetical protein
MRSFIENSFWMSGPGTLPEVLKLLCKETPYREVSNQLT